MSVSTVHENRARVERNLRERGYDERAALTSVPALIKDERVAFEFKQLRAAWQEHDR